MLIIFKLHSFQQKNFMKKIMTMAVAVLLVSGAAFAGGKKDSKDCCKKEGKSCQKESKSSKEKKTEKAAENATTPKA